MTRANVIPGLGHNARPLPSFRCPSQPGDAQALIFRHERPVTTAGKARTGQWVLRFERRTPPAVEPLMGWTAGDDTLATQVELRFDSREEAVAYAEREGLTYRVDREPMREEPSRRITCMPSLAECREAAGQLYTATAALAWMDPSYGVAAVGHRPDLDRALVNPAAVFSSPQEVLHDPTLTLEDKREILRRWAWDAWLLETAADEAMAGGEPSRLDEIKAALKALDRIEGTSVLVLSRNGSGLRPSATPEQG